MKRIDTVRAKLVGVAPLLMRNGQLADPLSLFSRELARFTGRRKKTEADLVRISDLEFLGGLWLEGGSPCIRGDAIESALCQSAARSRSRGRFRSGVVVKGNPRLDYDGPRTPEDLRLDPSFRLRIGVTISGRRLFRTRPSFRIWSAEVEIDILTSLVSRDELLDALVVAGDTIGIGDFRPKHGRFEVVAL